MKPQNSILVVAVCAVLQIVANSKLHAQLSSGLIAHYPFNGNAYDASGRGHTARIDGAVLTSDAGGNLNGAFGFDGVNDRLWITNHPDFEFSGNFSVAAWVRRSQPGRSMGDPILSKYGQAADGRTHFLFRCESSLNVGAERLGFWWWNSGWRGGTVGPQVLDTEWQHVAAVVNGSQVLMFLDGSGVGALSVTAPLLPKNEPLQIATSSLVPSTGRFLGMIGPPVRTARIHFGLIPL